MRNCSFLLLLLLAVFSSAFAKDRLLVDEVLNRGEFISSPNGAYTLILQPDGSLVMYRALDGSVRYSMAKTGTLLKMQADGNLVEYRDGTAIWDSNTDGACDGCWLQIYDNGDLTVGKVHMFPFYWFFAWQIGQDPLYSGGPAPASNPGVQALSPPGPAPYTIPNPDTPDHL